MQFLGILVFILCHVSSASENLGTFHFSDWLIQSSFQSTESGGSQFSLDNSYVFFKWDYNSDLTAQVGLGNTLLINPSRFSNSLSTVSEELGFFEVYAQWDSHYGLIRAGLVPLNFGWEGSTSESEWVLPATQFVENRYIGRRDYGVSYLIEHNSFFLNTSIHNGEGGADTDGNIWYTTKFGWKNRAGFETGISGQVGDYRQTIESKNRLAGFYAGWRLYKVNFVMEGFLGDKKNSSGYEQFSSWHVDLSTPVGPIVMQARYDVLDPNKTTLNDKTTRIIVGVNISNEESTSNLYLWGIKNQEEVEIINDELMLVWKVTSFSL